MSLREIFCFLQVDASLRLFFLFEFRAMSMRRVLCVHVVTVTVFIQDGGLSLSDATAMGRYGAGKCRFVA